MTRLTMPISLSDTYGLTHASSLRALTTASPGNYEATFSFIFARARCTSDLTNDACRTSCNRDRLAVYYRSLSTTSGGPRFSFPGGSWQGCLGLRQGGIWQGYNEANGNAQDLTMPASRKKNGSYRRYMNVLHRIANLFAVVVHRY